MDSVALTEKKKCPNTERYVKFGCITQLPPGDHRMMSLRFSPKPQVMGCRISSSIEKSLHDLENNKCVRKCGRREFENS